MFKTFLSYYKPYKGILLFLVIGSLLRALLELFFPYVVKLMLEQQLPLKNLPLLLEWSAALLAMYLVNFGMHFSIIYWAQSMSYSLGAVHELFYGTRHAPRFVQPSAKAVLWLLR